MRDYNLDTEILAFIDDYLAVSRNLSTASSISQQRGNYDIIVQHFRYPRPPGVTSHDSEVAGRHGSIALRHYRVDGDNHGARLVFIHGGGFILGSLDSHDDICAEICAACGLNLVSIDYRLAPEHHHPTQLDDVEDAFLACWQPGMVVIGVSAGGTLAAALAHRLKSSPSRPAAQLLIYPGLGGDMFELASYRENAQAPLLTTEDILFYRHARCADAQLPTTDAEFYPLQAIDFHGLPRSVAVSAEVDPLRDDARLYVEKLTAAGVCAEWICETGLVHDFLRARHVSTRAGAAFERICRAIRQLAG